MMGARIRRYIFALFCLVLTVQPVAPYVLAATPAADGTSPGWICAPFGTPSADAQRATDELLRILEDDREGEREADRTPHCPLCTLGSAAILPAPIKPAHPAPAGRPEPAQGRSALYVPQAKGPPVGLRAPPALH